MPYLDWKEVSTVQYDAVIINDNMIGLSDNSGFAVGDVLRILYANEPVSGGRTVTVSTVNSKSLIVTSGVLKEGATIASLYISTQEGEVAGAGGVTGAASSTDNTIARMNGTTGKVIQGSGIGVDDSNNMTFPDSQLIRPKLKDYSETVNAIGAIGGGTQDIDLELGNVVTATVDTAETTFTFSNPPATASNGSFSLMLTNGGSQTVNWPVSVDWAGGTAPTLTASGVDVLVFTTNDAGTTWYGFASGLDLS